MIVLGPKFGSDDGHKVPFAWIIAALTLFGAIITGEYIIILYIYIVRDLM